MIAPTVDPLTYTVTPLDRAPHLRDDPSQLKALMREPGARFVPIWNERHLVDGEVARFLAHGDVERGVADGAPLVFLGLTANAPWFAVGYGGELPPALRVAGEFRPLNDVVLLLPGDQAALLAYARAMVIWHGNHQYCGRCGWRCESAEGGHSRNCTNPACGHRTFPRTDPVVITLIVAGDRCLLGRQAAWPPGMYSAIAGFVEPGETLEAAVRREAEEETGVTLGAVRYVASQPWPFPASLMLGFEADAATIEVGRTDNELEDCRWFTRAEIATFGERNSPEPGFKLPSRYAIARLLVDRWLRRGLPGASS